MRVFTEIQRLPRWIYIIMIPSFIVILSLVIYNYVNAASEAKKNELLMVLLVIILAEALGILFVTSMKQVTRIDKTGIYYKYPPFKIKEAHIPTINIEHYDLVTYSTPYYGYRIGFWNVLGRPPSITVIGIRKAVRLGFKDGKTLLIGTRTPGDLLKTLDYITQKQE